jgi:hypothetical protein
VIRVLPPGEKTPRQIAPELVRAWADRRLVISDLDGHRYAQRERLVVTAADRQLLEACADDIERGRR